MRLISSIGLAVFIASSSSSSGTVDAFQMVSPSTRISTAVSAATTQRRLQSSVVVLDGSSNNDDNVETDDVRSLTLSVDSDDMSLSSRRDMLTSMIGGVTTAAALSFLQQPQPLPAYASGGATAGKYTYVHGSGSLSGTDTM